MKRYDITSVKKLSKSKQFLQILAIIIWIALGIYGFFFINILRADVDLIQAEIKSDIRTETSDGEIKRIPLGQAVEFLTIEIEKIKNK